MNILCFDQTIATFSKFWVSNVRNTLYNISYCTKIDKNFSLQNITLQFLMHL